MWMKPISPCCKPDGIMIQFLFTGKGISLRTCGGKTGLSWDGNQCLGEKAGSFFSYDKEKDRKVKGTEVTVRK